MWLKELMTEQQLEQLYIMSLENEIIGQSTACTLCEFAVENIKRYINQTQDEIKSILKQQCQRLPDRQLSSICQTVVLLYGDKLIDAVIKFPTEAACQKIGLCPTINELVFAEPPVINPADFVEPKQAQCTICQLLATQAHNYLSNNATEEYIKNALYRVCAVVPPKFAEHCKETVDINLSNLLAFLKQKYPPKKICEMLGMCDAAALNKEPEIEKEAIPVCPLCMMIVSELEKMVQKPDNKEKIANALGKVCQRLPEKFRSSCKVLVDTYTPQIIDKILERASPSAVCKFIKACKPPAKAEEPIVVELPKEIEEQLIRQNSQYCALCLNIASYVHQTIANNRTQEQIVDALQRVCKHVPPSVQPQCEIIVPMAFKQLVQWFLENKKPSVICQQLKFCPERSPYFDMEISSELVCNGCKTLVDISRNFINKDSTVEEIKRALNRACGFFPPNLQGMCNLVVEQYGEEIVRKLSEKVLDSDKVCSAVRACPRTFSEDDILAQIQEQLEQHMLIQ